MYSGRFRLYALPPPHPLYVALDIQHTCIIISSSNICITCMNIHRHYGLYMHFRIAAIFYTLHCRLYKCQHNTETTMMKAPSMWCTCVCVHVHPVLTDYTHLFEDVLLANELLTVPVWLAGLGDWVGAIAAGVLFADDEEDEVFQKTCDVSARRQSVLYVRVQCTCTDGTIHRCVPNL